MKLRLLDLLVCPIDKSRMELVPWESFSVTLSREDIDRIERLGLDPKQFSTEISSGVLLNRDKKIIYPIHEGVPRMLVFRNGVSKQFVKMHSGRLKRDLPAFEIPGEPAMPGEETVLRTFSSEWVNYDWDSGTYWNLSSDVMYKTMHFLLDLARNSVRDKLVLEVGIGIGGISDYMAREEGAEIVGLDLSYAVDPAYKYFGKNPFLHIVQASVFMPPLRENGFDLVYSHGVLHHTYSTRTAFERISKLPKKGGRLYVWVYSPYDENRSLERRILMRIERFARPVMWRLPSKLQTIALLPIVPLYMLRQNLFPDRRDGIYIRYGIREAFHAARDRFTPRYVHRHSEDEISEWFSNAGYASLQSVSGRDRPTFVPSAYVFATAIDGIRQ